MLAELELNHDQLGVVRKSLSITQDVLHRKISQLKPGTFRHDEAKAEYELIQSVLEEVSAAVQSIL